VDRPTQAVWISTRGGANSGKTSTRIPGNEMTPMTMIAAAAATTRYRNLRLDATIRPISVCGARGGASALPAGGLALIARR
jgi:hypothetical protein